MSKKALRVSMYMIDDDYQVIKVLADKMGISFSKACAMTVRLGVQSLKLAFDPTMKEVYEKQLKEQQ